MLTGCYSLTPCALAVFASKLGVFIDPLSFLCGHHIWKIRHHDHPYARLGESWKQGLQIFRLGRLTKTWRLRIPALQIAHMPILRGRFEERRTDNVLAFYRGARLHRECSLACSALHPSTTSDRNESPKIEKELGKKSSPGRSSFFA